jgi:hypothetical protein
VWPSGYLGFAIRVQCKSVGTLQINTAALHTQQVLSRCQLIIAVQPSQCSKSKKKNDKIIVFTTFDQKYKTTSFYKQK